MHARREGTLPPGPRTRRDLASVQVLLDLKNSDPTALTAAEAIRSLLGFGDRLVEIRRRSLHELVLGGPEQAEKRAALPDLLSAYLEGTVVFWNPNKQRAWVRLAPAGSPEIAWEVMPGAKRKPADFGRPDLSRPDYDHLLVWPRGSHAVPADLLPALAEWEVAAAGQGELWSLRWREGATAEERGAWTRAVGATHTRREGLLCNPHAQSHRVLSGAVPMPLWSHGDPGTSSAA
jgi:hypothetical protein